MKDFLLKKLKDQILYTIKTSTEPSTKKKSLVSREDINTWVVDLKIKYKQKTWSKKRETFSSSAEKGER